MYDNSSKETSYIFCDAYDHIYSITIRILLDPKQYELQTEDNNIEVEERATSSATTVSSTPVMSRYPTSKSA